MRDFPEFYLFYCGLIWGPNLLKGIKTLFLLFLQYETVHKFWKNIHSYFLSEN